MCLRGQKNEAKQEITGTPLPLGHSFGAGGKCLCYPLKSGLFLVCMYHTGLPMNYSPLAQPRQALDTRLSYCLLYGFM